MGASLKNTFRQSLLLIWIGAALFMGNRAQAAVDTKSAEHILRFYRTPELLESVYIRFENALNRHRQDEGVSEMQLRGLALIGRRIYQAPNLFKILVDAYALVISIHDVRDILEWQKTPLGLRFSQGLKDFFLTSDNALNRYLKKNKFEGMKPNRKNTLSTFFKAQEQDAIYVNLEAGADLGVLLGLSGYASAKEREKSEKIMNEMQAKRMGFAGKSQKEWLRQNFFALKDLRNDEIDLVSKFAMSAAGQGHSQALLKALDFTLAAAGKTLRDQVIKESAAATAPATR